MDTLEIQKGNICTVTLTFKDEDGDVYDLTAKTVFFTMKDPDDFEADDDDAIITKDITSHTDPTNGITTLTLSATQTDVAVGRYKCDLRLYDEGSVQINTSTFFANVVEVVTKRTS
jgi:hypothetical protein